MNILQDAKHLPEPEISFDLEFNVAMAIAETGQIELSLQKLQQTEGIQFREGKKKE